MVFLRRKWQPTPVFLAGKSHRLRSLVGYSPLGSQSQTRLSDFTFTFGQMRLVKEIAVMTVLIWSKLQHSLLFLGILPHFWDSNAKISFYLFIFAVSCSMQDLSSLTRHQTFALCLGNRVLTSGPPEKTLKVYFKL